MLDRGRKETAYCSTDILGAAWGPSELSRAGSGLPAVGAVLRAHGAALLNSLKQEFAGLFRNLRLGSAASMAQHILPAYTQLSLDGKPEVAVALNTLWRELDSRAAPVSFWDARTEPPGDVRGCASPTGRGGASSCGRRATPAMRGVTAASSTCFGTSRPDMSRGGLTYQPVR